MWGRDLVGYVFANSRHCEYTDRTRMCGINGQRVVLRLKISREEKRNVPFEILFLKLWSSELTDYTRIRLLPPLIKTLQTVSSVYSFVLINCGHVYISSTVALSVFCVFRLILLWFEEQGFIDAEKDLLSAVRSVQSNKILNKCIIMKRTWASRFNSIFSKRIPQMEMLFPCFFLIFIAL